MCFCVVRASSPIPARRPTCGVVLPILAIGFFVSSLAAQAQTGEPSAAQWVAARAPAAIAPIEIDGVLDEPIWQEAEVVALAYETEPGENSPAPIATTCRLLYDDERLYVGCSAEDPHPEEIRARFTDRDQAYDGDFVGVRLDPFLDRRRAFEFYVNPLGVQMDLFRDDLAAERQGGDDSEDTSWDALWDSAGRITAGGLRGRARDSLLLAALSSRRRGADLGHRLRAGPAAARSPASSRASRSTATATARSASCRRSRGFAGISPGRHLELDPTLTVQRVETTRGGSGRAARGG